MDAKLSRLVDDLQLQLPGAIPNQLQVALRNVLRQFFIETNAWKQDIQFDTVVGAVGYPLSISISADPVRLLYVLNADNMVVGLATMPEDWIIVIPNSPSTVETWTARVVLTINADADSDGYPIFPEWVLGRYYDTILNGTLARMFAQVAKPYSNPQMAAYYQKQFRGGMVDARNQESIQNIYGGQRWRYPGYARNTRAAAGGIYVGGGSFGADFSPDFAGGFGGGTGTPMVSLTKSQLLQAVSANLTGGIFGFEQFISASPDDAYNIALRYSDSATGITPALMAYMQAPTNGSPPGLGMSLTAAASTYASLIATAANKPS